MTKERFFVMDVWRSNWRGKDCLTCYGYGKPSWEIYYVIEPKKDIASKILFYRASLKPWLNGQFGVGI